MVFGVDAAEIALAILAVILLHTGSRCDPLVCVRVRLAEKFIAAAAIRLPFTIGRGDGAPMGVRIEFAVRLSTSGADSLRDAGGRAAEVRRLVLSRVAAGAGVVMSVAAFGQGGRPVMVVGVFFAVRLSADFADRPACTGGRAAAMARTYDRDIVATDAAAILFPY